MTSFKGLQDQGFKVYPLCIIKEQITGGPAGPVNPDGPTGPAGPTGPGVPWQKLT